MLSDRCAPFKPWSTHKRVSNSVAQNGAKWVESLGKTPPMVG